MIPGARIRAGLAVQITASRQRLAPVSRSIALSPGAVVTRNFQMAAQVILLEDVVVTGTPGPIEVATNRNPGIGQVNASDLQVPTTSAAGAIQAKVPGTTIVSGTGPPGNAPAILLRGPRSINAAGNATPTLPNTPPNAPPGAPPTAHPGGFNSRLVSMPARS